MNLPQKLTIFHFLFLFSINKQISTIEISLVNNGYEGIVVAFSPNTTEERGFPLIKNIKELFVNASKVLYEATYRRVYFKKVAILVPETWEKKAEYLKATSENFNSAAIRIDDPNPANGDCPYTLQHMGCGYPGLYIHLTFNYLKYLKTKSIKSYGDPAKTLVHEWAHYKYGVFDEYGYSGDGNFPMFYWDPDMKKLAPNFCADQQIIGRYWDIYDDQPCLYDENGIPDEKCLFIPASNSHNEIKTSLSSYYYMENVQFFCNETNHNHHAPNKQNILCDQKSAWDVIMENKDLSKAQPTQLDPTSVEFKIIQQSEPTFILVLDISASMNEEFNGIYTKLQMLQDTVTRWINYQVKLGWSVGIVSFNDDAYLDFNLTKITNDSVRTTISNNIPRFADHRTCIGCGLKMAVENLRIYRNDSGGTIILVSDGEELTNNIKVKHVIKLLVASRVRVISIIFTQTASKTLEKVAKITNGRTFFVSQKTGMKEMESAFYEAFAQQETYLNTTVKVAESQFNVTQNGVMNGSFTIDKTIGNDVTISFAYQNKAKIANIRITDSDNVTLAVLIPFKDKSQKKIPVEIKNNSNTFHFKFAFLKPGRYHYLIQVAPNQDNKIITVTVLSDASKTMTPITATCWKQMETKNKNRLIIFARVKQGNSPVIKATVMAEIERPDETTTTMQLLDNGSGSDVASNDGVYSKYFTKFVNATGRYSVKVTVRGNNSTRIRKKGYFASRTLTLNFQQTPLDTNNVPTGFFERVSTGGSFQPIKNFTTADTIPPIKVRDLRLINVSKDANVYIEWTAPGNDLDDGKVSQYDIKYSTDLQTLSSQFNGTRLNTSHIIPVTSGRIQTCSWKIPELNTNSIVYLALKAADDIPNWSKLSNIITIISPVVKIVNKKNIQKIRSPNLTFTKVKDLKSVKVYENGTVNLQWTAPHNVLKHKVYEYDIRYSEHVGMIAKRLIGNRLRTDDLTKVKPGKIQSLIVTIPELTSTKNIYIALRTREEYEYFKWSPISNVVIVRKPVESSSHIPISIKMLVVIVLSFSLLFVVLNITVWYLRFK